MDAEFIIEHKRVYHVPFIHLNSVGISRLALGGFSESSFRILPRIPPANSSNLDNEDVDSVRNGIVFETHFANVILGRFY